MQGSWCLQKLTLSKEVLSQWIHWYDFSQWVFSDGNFCFYMVSPQCVLSGVIGYWHFLKKSYHNGYTDMVSPQWFVLRFEFYFYMVSPQCVFSNVNGNWHFLKKSYHNGYTDMVSPQWVFSDRNNNKITLLYLLFSQYEHFIMSTAHYMRLTLDIFENHTSYTLMVFSFMGIFILSILGVYYN